ncbi:ankyrin repeat-containing protein [Penicillium viridicatum]|nr:ankyrin repeat-containing protein [Penicillium viridicatum]
MLASRPPKATLQLRIEAAGHISEMEWAPGGTTSFVSAGIQDAPSPDKSLLARNKINFNTTDECGRSPLFYCLYNDNMGMMRMLLHTGEVDVDCTYQGRTTLSYAAEVGEEPVKLLLSLDAVNLASKDSYGRTPHHYAALRGDVAVMKVLLDTGKVDVDSTDFEGLTPLPIVTDIRGYENKEAAQFLISFKAKC